MYNEEQKIKFLKETRGTRAYGKSIFDTTQPYEEECGMDLCLFTPEMLQRVLNEKLGIRSQSISIAIKFFQSYTSWCRGEGIETSDGAFHVVIDTSEKIKKSMLSSPLHLNIVLDQVFDAIEEETTDCLYRCYLWMAFMGIDDVDAKEVKVGDVDFTAMMIRINGSSYVMYRESLSAFRNACNLNDFAYKHPKYTKIIRRERVKSKYLMRGIKSEKISTSTIRGAIWKRMTDSGYKTSYRNIYLSGLFYRVYELERAGATPDFFGEVIKQMNSIERTYSSNYTYSKAANAIERHLIEDYERWKAAFE